MGHRDFRFGSLPNPATDWVELDDVMAGFDDNTLNDIILHISIGIRIASSMLNNSYRFVGTDWGGK